MPAATLAATSDELAVGTDLRRRLHQIPEIAYQEFKTAELIRSELTRLGIPFVAGPADAPTATIAWLGDPTKPCIALRADIDALPISEATGADYASTHPGNMHACGHDGHAANLLTAAAVFKRAVAKLPVCVKLIFQPAEEGGGGAEVLVKAGVLDGRIGPKVSQIFGLHGWPGLPLGVVSTRPGPLMASTDALKITVRGSGCHGAFPHLGRDPIVVAAEILISLQTVVSRETDPTDSSVVTIGTFHAGTATNVIPDVAVLTGTVRALNDATRARNREAILRRCKGIADAYGCVADVEYEQGYPATQNDPAMAQRVATTARDLFGPARFLPAATPVMGGEDFAYYLEKVPGAFFFVGLCPEGRASYPPLHTDRFDFVDAALDTGTKMFLSLVEQFANENR